MSQNVSTWHTTAILNGHTCQGWARTDNAIELPDIQVTENEVGPDGLKVSSHLGNLGGNVILRFLPNSPSVSFFGHQFSQVQQGKVVEFEGTVNNSLTGLQTTLTRGTFETGPSGLSYGDGIPGPVEFTFHFERILTDYSSMATTERLATDIGT